MVVDIAAQHPIQTAFNLAALLADDLSGSGGSNDDRQFLASSLKEDVGNRREGWGSVQSLIDELADSIVLNEQFAEEGFGCKPP